jgi:hypothetical protein
MTTADAIGVLQQQQALITQALRAMLEGTWCGAPPSGEAFVDALDPNSPVQNCLRPVLVSDAPPPTPRAYDPNTTQYSQLYNWTCSACATDWLLRAYGSGFAGDDWYDGRTQTIEAIGYPANINPTYGLMDGSGSQLQRVLADQGGLYTSQGWLSFDQAYAVYSAGMGGCMSGGAWYHWVGVRGVDGSGNLWVANSAPGYQGVWDTLSRADFNRLGPFSCLAVLS